MITSTIATACARRGGHLAELAGASHAVLCYFDGDAWSGITVSQLRPCRREVVVCYAMKATRINRSAHAGQARRRSGRGPAGELKRALPPASRLARSVLPRRQDRCRLCARGCRVFTIEARVRVALLARAGRVSDRDAGIWMRPIPRTARCPARRQISAPASPKAHELGGSVAMARPKVRAAANCGIVSLPDPENKILPGGMPRPARASFAPETRPLRPSLAKRAQHRLIRVGSLGSTPRLLAGKLAEDTVMPLQRRRRIAIKRRATAPSSARLTLGVQHALR